MILVSTLSIRPATWTLRSKWSATCASSTAPSPFSTRLPASSPTVRDGLAARPTATTSRALPSSTRWTASRRLLPGRAVDGRAPRREAGARQLPARARGGLPRRRRPDRDARAFAWNDPLGVNVEESGFRPSSASRPAVPPPADRRDRREGRGAAPDISGGRGRRRRDDPPRAAQGDSRRRGDAGAARLRIQEQGHPAAARRRGRLPAEPLDVPPVHGLDPRTDHELSRRPALDEPFAAWRSRSCPTRTWAGCAYIASTRAESRAATRC